MAQKATKSRCIIFGSRRTGLTDEYLFVSFATATLFFLFLFPQQHKHTVNQHVDSYLDAKKVYIRRI